MRALPAKLPLYLCLLLLTQCSKCKNDPAPADPAGQLPPATQSGANTFGFLLNGQPWTPSGNDSTPNYRVTYDPNYKGGNLVITVYRNLSNSKHSQYMSFGGVQISRPGTYVFTTSSIFPTPVLYSCYYYDDSKSSPCDDFSTHPGTTTDGQLVITRLDLKQGIVSGTFHFTLAQPGCDTVKITKGRFDKGL